MIAAEPSSATATEVLDERRRCVACEHDLAEHDRISLRYCQATHAQGSTRSCICR